LILQSLRPCREKTLASKIDIEAKNF